jgi:hypothetical protein
MPDLTAKVIATLPGSIFADGRDRLRINIRASDHVSFDLDLFEWADLGNVTAGDQLVVHISRATTTAA